MYHGHSPCPPPALPERPGLFFALGRLAGLTGALAVAAAARTRSVAERFVWGFEDGFEDRGCPAAARGCAVCHRHLIDCVPERPDPCRSCRR